MTRDFKNAGRIPKWNGSKYFLNANQKGNKERLHGCGFTGLTSEGALNYVERDETKGMSVMVIRRLKLIQIKCYQII